jgi:hypothetical protein
MAGDGRHEIDGLGLSLATSELEGCTTHVQCNCSSAAVVPFEFTFRSFGLIAALGLSPQEDSSLRSGCAIVARLETRVVHQLGRNDVNCSSTRTFICAGNDLGSRSESLN